MYATAFSLLDTLSENNLSSCHDVHAHMPTMRKKNLTMSSCASAKCETQRNPHELLSPSYRVMYPGRESQIVTDTFNSMRVWPFPDICVLNDHICFHACSCDVPEVVCLPMSACPDHIWRIVNKYKSQRKPLISIDYTPDVGSSKVNSRSLKYAYPLPASSFAPAVSVDAGVFQPHSNCYVTDDCHVKPAVA